MADYDKEFRQERDHEKQIQTYVHQISELEQANLSLQGIIHRIQEENRELKERMVKPIKPS